MVVNDVAYEPVSAGSYTAEYDLFMSDVIADITDRISDEDKTDPDRSARAFLRAAVAAGAVPRLLSGLLTPVGVPWSIETARQAERAFSEPMPPDVRRQAVLGLVDGVQRFFALGPRSSPTSR